MPGQRCRVCLLVALTLCRWGHGMEYKVPTGPDKFARIMYDAVGNVELDEGTVEMWVRNDFDPLSQMTNRFYMPISYFRVHCGPKVKSPIGVIARHSTSSKDVFVTVGRASGGVRLSRLGWKQKREWHCLAVTWKYQDGQCTRKVYVDGKRRNKVVADQKPMAMRANAKILVGAYYFNCCFAAVDQLRVSAVERTDAEIEDSFQNGLKWDVLTLLFDDFDKIEARGRSKAITRAGKGKTGTIEGSYRLIDGKFGKALQLHVIEEEIK